MTTGRTQTFETTMLKPDGTRFPSLNSAALIRDAAGRPQAIIGMARDITALKQAEAELRQSEQRFRLMAETIQDVFWIATPAHRQNGVCESGLRAGLGPDPPGVVSVSPKLFWRPSIRRIGSEFKSEIVAAREQGSPSGPRIPDYQAGRDGALDS